MPLPAEQSHIFEETLSTRRGRSIMETKLERISQLSRKNPDRVFTSIGHLIDKAISGFMKDGVPVPYVDVVEYMNKVYDPENVFSLSSQGSGVYEIGNAKGNMIVDTIKDALHSDRIEQIPLPLILTLQSTE